MLVTGFLSGAACAELIAMSEARGYASAATDYPPSYRNNDRHVIDSAPLAASLGERIRAHAPDSMVADGRAWHFDGVNVRFRFCRYNAGQRFSIHQDGIHHRGPDCRSLTTVLIYLTDSVEGDGGDTVFYGQGPGAAEGVRELGRVRPQAGSLLLFDHAIWHAGEEVASGTKHVLRSDILYRAAAVDSIPTQRHQGYLWTLAALDEGCMASGGRDAAIRIWDRAGQPLRALHGHTQSVLGLAPLPGQRVASVSRDRTLRIWNWATGACEMTVPAHATAVLDVLALPEGMLATGGADGIVKLWNQDGSAAGNLAGHAGWVWHLARLDDGLLASASEDGAVRLWDTTAMRCIAVLDGGQPLRTLAVVDGAIWTGDVAGTVTCWTRAAGAWRRAATFQAHRAAVRRLRYLGDGQVASGGEDGAMRVWDARGHAQLFEAWHDNFVTDVLRRGATIVSSAYDGKILHHV
jgi:WD40 repeat protein/predicted 2-oxoglutarate/Fe(II)-dependent dioxygenase YbiX